VSNVVLTAHAGTFIRPRNRAGNAWSRIWEATENRTIEAKGGWGYPRPGRVGHDNSCRVVDFRQARVTSLIRDTRPDYSYPGQS
jgi:hypothetical protein